MLEAQVQPPASTAPARIEKGPRKRRRVLNKLYRDSQYELCLAGPTARSRGGTWATAMLGATSRSIAIPYSRNAVMRTFERVPIQFPMCVGAI
jgi:hypothetical protein